MPKVPTVYKKDIIQQVSLTIGKPKTEITEVVDAFLDCIVHNVSSGSKVNISDLCIASVKDVPERQRRNPQTGANVTVSAHKKIALKPSKPFKDAVNK